MSAAGTTKLAILRTRRTSELCDELTSYLGVLIGEFQGECAVQHLASSRAVA